ncbi:protein-disulfide reductase DsbD domain-containing protein [Oceanicella sp. SM1341]|uniref:protein-disulfide reductase DsbD domain-containing protein n=1 Tax=Oceanicella sp. SM1341 TaxID=1548889 RepID=UPI001300B0FE|nr:protein-disulfide reductase DsbD domain-containing protein [Oceanicella sp. SM1341]
MTRQIALAAALAALAGAGATLPAAAQSAPPSEVALIDGWAERDGARMVAIAVSLAPGWKTYWRAPGEAGIPPSFDWSGSRNLERVEFFWPVPEVIDSYGMQTLGYHDRLVLPVKLVPRDPSAPLHVAVEMEYGVCADICVPAEALALGEMSPGAPAAPSAGVIRDWLQRLPESPDQAGVTEVSCTLVPQGDGFDIDARVRFDHALSAAPQVVMMESPVEDLWIEPADPQLEGGHTVSARAAIDYLGAGPLALDRSSLRVTLIGGGRAVEIHGCPAPR